MLASLRANETALVPDLDCAATKSSTSFDVMDAALAIPCSPSQRTYWSMSFSYACTAVSYTHLDVYKRQVPESFSDLRLPTRRVGMLKNLLGNTSSSNCTTTTPNSQL